MQPNFQSWYCRGEASTLVRQGILPVERAYNTLIKQDTSKEDERYDVELNVKKLQMDEP